IQRPFVWSATKVRNLIDSLYKGYPIGYLITWQSPNVKLKDGSLSQGKIILIDGQQRIIALKTAILGEEIIDKNYQKRRIKIAFNPIIEKFEVCNPAIEKDKTWISDISPIVKNEIDLLSFLDDYCEKNPNFDRSLLLKIISQLQAIDKRQVGIIELSGELDIDIVAEIFERINSEGVTLSQADFVMSRIAANEKYQGSTLRKAIDYFCHLAKESSFYEQIKSFDNEFTKSEYFQKMAWLKKEIDDLYDPDYKDVIRTVFTFEFKRGKLADLVSLLIGRSFETKSYEEKIIEETFTRFKNGFFNYINETNFKRFIMILKSAGFIANWMIRSKITINFTYALFLYLRANNFKSEDIERIVRKWLVISLLTERYIGSSETRIDQDIRLIERKGVVEYLKEIEEGELSESFWSNVLVRKLESPISTIPAFNLFLAAQVKDQDRGFLSTDIKVSNLIDIKGDLHHIFPKDYLKKNGFQKNLYNQVANYVYMQQELNIKIGNQSPKEYMRIIKKQIEDKKTYLSNYKNIVDLQKNLEENCIPDLIFEGDFKNYEEFLSQRRRLMAQRLKEYYFAL
ncbi:MAG: DUF262 domain-containing protein, partial [Microgenomates group bacterium]